MSKYFPSGFNNVLYCETLLEQIVVTQLPFFELVSVCLTFPGTYTVGLVQTCSENTAVVSFCLLFCVQLRSIVQALSHVSLTSLLSLLMEYFSSTEAQEPIIAPENNFIPGRCCLGNNCAPLKA